MSFLGPSGGPQLGGVNLLTGAGNKYTDPLQIFTPPPPPTQPAIPAGPGAWVGDAKSSAQRAAAVSSGTTPPTLDETKASISTLGGGDKDKQ